LVEASAAVHGNKIPLLARRDLTIGRLRELRAYPIWAFAARIWDVPSVELETSSVGARSLPKK
jgi:hypothetical protein